MIVTLNPLVPLGILLILSPAVESNVIKWIELATIVNAVVFLIKYILPFNSSILSNSLSLINNGYGAILSPSTHSRANLSLLIHSSLKLYVSTEEAAIFSWVIAKSLILLVEIAAFSILTSLTAFGANFSFEIAWGGILPSTIFG